MRIASFNMQNLRLRDGSWTVRAMATRLIRRIPRSTGPTGG